MTIKTMTTIRKNEKSTKARFWKN